jgi:hypothetical protein
MASRMTIVLRSTDVFDARAVTLVVDRSAR